MAIRISRRIDVWIFIPVRIDLWAPLQPSFVNFSIHFGPIKIGFDATVFYTFHKALDIGTRYRNV